MDKPPPVPALPSSKTLRKYPSKPDVFGPYPFYEAHVQAMYLVYDAWEVESVTNKFHLCRRALGVFPFCVDAYNCMADLYNRIYNDFDKAIEAYEHARKCAQLLWPGIEDQEEIPWGEVDNRPFLRAIHGLAVVFIRLNRKKEAIDHLRFLLRVNPNDNQGCRSLVVEVLIDCGLYEEAEEAAAKYSNGRKSTECYFRYSFVVIDFWKWKHGKDNYIEKDLEETLVQALQCNGFVPHLLLEEQVLPKPEPHYSPGDIREAEGYVRSSLPTWKKVEGLLEWLRDVRSRGGDRPDDDGAILFEMLTKRNVLLYLERKSKRRVVEATTRVQDIPGRALETFKLPVGMKDHDPSRIVCYNTGRDSSETRGYFDSFSYAEVIQIPFWNVLHTSAYSESREEHCDVCYKPANFVCSRCKVSWYCSKTCQAEGWKGKKHTRLAHKKMCKKFIKQ